MVTLYMIPGSGTDRRMYTPQFEQFPDMIVPQWLPPLNKKEPIKSYAKRLSATIDTSSPFMLGGTSLGGMIAQEMATHVSPLALILISTCSSSKAIPFLPRMSGKLMRALPDGVVKFMFSCTAALVRKSRDRNKDMYAQMLDEMPPSLVRWQSGASTEWALTQSLPMPVFHIHGAKDPIIPVKNVSAQAVVDGGGHLINVTHAERVNAFIAECLRRNDAADKTLARAG